jgi:hypothetical protein
MKKIQFMSLMALMLLASNTAMAQLDSKSEISFSVGGGTPNERGIGEAIGEGLGKAIISAITGGLYNPNETRRDDSSTLAFNLQYLYRIAPKIKVGGALTYQHTSTTLMVADNNGTYHDAAKANNDYFTVMPVVKAMWIEKNHIGLYSKAAAGICIASNSAKACSGFGAAEKYIDEIKSDKGTSFAYQVSAIGFEAGSKNIRGFVELGYGFQGFAQAGVSVKF